MNNEKRYVVKAYLEKSMRGLMECLETDDWSEVEDFIWKHCQEGLNCQFIDHMNYMSNCGEAYVDLFDENTVEVEELIVRYSFM